MAARTEEASWLQDPGGGLATASSGEWQWLPVARRENKSSQALTWREISIGREGHMTKRTDVSAPSPTDHREAKALSQYPSVPIKMFPSAR